MNIRRLQREDLADLYGLWEQIGQGVPCFFPVDFDTWKACLLEFWQGHSGLRLVEGEVWVAVEAAADGEQITGFVQFGKPNFTWDDNGQKLEDPNVGVIRHLYYLPGHEWAGEALLQQARQGMASVEKTHAFFHAHGMACNAWHGKLFPSLRHIEGLLKKYDFVVEQENPYYTLSIGDAEQVRKSRSGLEVIPVEDTGFTHHFEAHLHGDKVGTARMNPLAALTGGLAQDAVYMSWIGVNKELRGQGLGSEFLLQLADHYRQQGYAQLHLDTASTNLTAQRFYEKHGFAHRGSTRSYVRR